MISIEKANILHASTITDFQIEMAWESEEYVLQRDVIKRGVEHVFTDEDQGFYIIAKVDEVVVGSLMITYEWSDWRCSQIWWLQSVFVMKDYRSQGVFTAMYEFIKNLAAQNHVQTIRLYMEKNNDTAQKAYLKNNFEVTHYVVLEHKLQD